MKLTDDDVQRFNDAYAKDWGERLPIAEARVMAGRLLHLYASIRRACTRSTLADAREIRYGVKDVTEEEQPP